MRACITFILSIFGYCIKNLFNFMPHDHGFFIQLVHHFVSLRFWLDAGIYFTGDARHNTCNRTRWACLHCYIEYAAVKKFACMFILIYNRPFLFFRPDFDMFVV